MPRKGEQGGDEISAMARELVRRHPDAPARTLGRRLAEEAGGAITLQQGYARIRGVLGLKGARLRRRAADRSLHRSPRAAGSPPPMPPSKAEPWGPFELGVTGTVGVLSDIHVPYHDQAALQAAVDQLKGDRIEGLVLNGDICDFYSISRYVKNPRRRNLKAEVQATREMLAWLRGHFPGIPVALKAGNHEERWAVWLHQHAPEISDDPRMGLEEWFDLPKLGIAYVEDKRPIMAGALPILHGHEKGNGISAPVNQARGAFLRLHHTVLEGHGHRTSAHCEPDMFGREVFCWSTGCLCDLHPEYAPINKFNHGFATVGVEPTGEFNVQNFRIANGKVRSS